MRGSRLPGAKGINGGIKLSTTARFARQENPRGKRVFSWRRLPEPGWGPGGRRFKSCLPDYVKAPMMLAFARTRNRDDASDGEQTGNKFPLSATSGTTRQLPGGNV
jgi:hypothetical protein